MHIMRAMRPVVPKALEEYAAVLHEYGAKSDLIESRKAFAEKRKPNFKGWDNAGDRDLTPRLNRSK